MFVQASQYCQKVDIQTMVKNIGKFFFVLVNHSVFIFGIIFVNKKSQSINQATNQSINQFLFYSEYLKFFTNLRIESQTHIYFFITVLLLLLLLLSSLFYVFDVQIITEKALLKTKLLSQRIIIKTLICIVYDLLHLIMQVTIHFIIHL